MPEKSLILISQNKEDADFFRKVSVHCDSPLVHISDWDNMLGMLDSADDSVIVWDMELTDKDIQKKIFRTLQREQVFSLRNKLTDGVADENMKVQHHLLRRYDDVSFSIYSNLIDCSFKKRPPLIDTFFKADTKVNKIKLEKSEHRGAAVEASQNFLVKKGYDQRIASKVAKSIDELLMNAIFSAPRSPDHQATHQMLDRKSKFALEKGKEVTLRIMSNDQYTGFAVTDLFGSLTFEVANRFLTQTFSSSDYKPRKTGPGAGLGLFGIVQSGLSILYVVHKEFQTESIMLMPNTPSYKEFRRGFQFSSYVSYS